MSSCFFYYCRDAMHCVSTDIIVTAIVTVHSHRFRTACRHGPRTEVVCKQLRLAVAWCIVETGRAPSLHKNYKYK